MDDQPKMWALLVEGPDDLYAVPDKETGDAAALLLNRQLGQTGDLPAYKVVEWPHAREAWEWQAPQFALAIVEV